MQLIALTGSRLTVRSAAGKLYTLDAKSDTASLKPLLALGSRRSP